MTRVLVGGPNASATGVAMAPDGSRVYVSTGAQSKVVVVDTADNTVIATVSRGLGSPSGLAVTSNGAKVYIANESGGFVSVLNTATNTLGPPIVIPNDVTPSNVTVTPDGRWVYVVSIDQDDPVTNTPVAVIDTATDTVATSFTAGTGTSAVAVTPDGRQVYVTNAFSIDVSVVDVATNTVIDTVPVGFRPVGIDFTEDGARAYVVNIGNTLSVIDTSTRQVVATVPIDGALPRSFGKFIGPNLTAGNLQFSRPVYTFSESGRLNRDGELVHSGRVIITRGGGKQGPVSVLVSTGNGTALAGSDYVHQSRRITFADGDNSPKYFIFPIIADTAPEFREALRVVLRNPSGGVTLGGVRTATVRITNDDE